MSHDGIAGGGSPMDTQLEGTAATTSAAADQKKPEIDPLRRVFVPIEKRTAAGTFVFRTTDRQLYARAGDGSIRRADKKARGKRARSDDKVHRRLLRRAQQKAERCQQS